MAATHYIGILVCALIMGVIVALGPYHSEGMLGPDQGWDWYYWKLSEPNFWTRFSAWSLYAIHQLGLWGLIAYAQRQRPRYRSALNPINIAAIGFNLLFVFIHIAQTKFFYDGLAQDTHVVSSQFSVILMLVFILIIENQRRGLVFGKAIPFAQRPAQFIRKYHGYYFAWAIVYTFWFHPIETTLGHILGTFYTLLLLLQGSLFFTTYHRNRYWTVLLEVFVLIHGAMVAYQTIQGDQWQMFLFGFLTLFVITQMHGIGLGNKAKMGLVSLYAAAVLVNYWGEWNRLDELLKIPAIEIGLVLAVAVICWLPYWFRRAPNS